MMAKQKVSHYRGEMVVQRMERKCWIGLGMPRWRRGSRRRWRDGMSFVTGRRGRSHFRGEIALSGTKTFFATKPRERILPEVVCGESAFYPFKRAIGKRAFRLLCGKCCC